MSVTSKLSKRWCFTVNNYTPEDKNTFLSLPCSYLVLGNEVSPSGTPHLQGFVTFPNPHRLSAMKKINPKAHWEIAKGTSEQAATYCKKENDYVELGKVPTQGKRTDLEIFTNRLKQGENVVAISNDLSPCFVKYSRGLRDFALNVQKPYTHDTVRGIWIYGPPGTGKSHKVRTDYPSLFVKGQNKWFDGYAGELAILIDDFDKQGICLSHHLKLWADRYSCSGETKGGTVHLQHRALIVTSNYRISELFFDDLVLIAALQRRFQVIHMPEMFKLRADNNSNPNVDTK